MRQNSETAARGGLGGKPGGEGPRACRRRALRTPEPNRVKNSTNIEPRAGLGQSRRYPQRRACARPPPPPPPRREHWGEPAGARRAPRRPHPGRPGGQQVTVPVLVAAAAPAAPRIPGAVEAAA